LGLGCGAWCPFRLAFGSLLFGLFCSLPLHIPLSADDSLLRPPPHSLCSFVEFLHLHFSPRPQFPWTLVFDDIYPSSAHGPLARTCDFPPRPLPVVPPRLPGHFFFPVLPPVPCGIRLPALFQRSVVLPFFSSFPDGGSCVGLGCLFFPFPPQRWLFSFFDPLRTGLVSCVPHPPSVSHLFSFFF